MVRQKINQIILTALASLTKEGVFDSTDSATAAQNSLNFCSPQKSNAHGDYSSNIALRLAHSSKKNPLEIANLIVSQIQKDKNSQIFSKIEIAAPGFINFVLSCQFLTSQTATALRAKNKYGRINIGKGKKPK